MPTRQLHAGVLLPAQQGVVQDLGRADDDVAALHRLAEEALVAAVPADGRHPEGALQDVELLLGVLLHQVHLHPKTPSAPSRDHRRFTLPPRYLPG